MTGGGNRRNSVMTRSSSRSALTALVDSQKTCLQSMTDDVNNNKALHQLRRSNSCRISKRKGENPHKAAFHKSKPSVERLASFQNMFDAMDIEDDSPFNLCDYCKSAGKFIYDCAKSGDIPDNCECETKAHVSDRNVVEQSPCIKAEAETQEFTSAQGPHPCFVTNSTTGMGWRARGAVLQAVHGPSPDLHYWSITATRNAMKVFVFGFETSRGWRYATVKNNNKIRFQSHSVHPSSIDIEREPLADNRLFHLEGSFDGGYLIPAARDNHYVQINTNHRRLHIEVTANQRLAHTWRIDHA